MFGRRQQARLILLAGVLLAGPFTSVVGAQPRDTVELQVGGAYAWSVCCVYSLATYEAGIALWWSDHWGIAARHGFNPGEHFYDPLEDEDGSDRVFLGPKNPQYTTLTARYRGFGDGGMEYDFGFGTTWGRYDDVWFLKGVNRSRRVNTTLFADDILFVDDETFRGLVVFELLVGRKVSRRVGVKVGYSHGLFGDDSIFRRSQLVGFAVIGF